MKVKIENIKENIKKYILLTNLSNIEKCIYFKEAIVKNENNIYYNDIYDNIYRKIRTKYNNFPDNSYYRLSPLYRKKENILLYTYDVQNYIYTFQNPGNCSNRKFLLITGYPSGQGIELRVIASLLGLAIHTNRIALYHPYYKTIHTLGKYCKNVSKTWECFLEPLSNCSVGKEYIQKAVVLSNINQTDKVVYIPSYEIKKYLFFVPDFIKRLINNTIIKYKNNYKFWSIQSLTYVIRLNDKTYEYINKNYKELNSLKYKKCMSVWIRHGDKIKEMKLIPTYQYEKAVTFFKSIVNENFIIYLSSDDPNVFKEMNRNYLINYLKFNRSDYNKTRTYKVKGGELTIYVLADIKGALSCYSFCGTIKSNIIKIINELRMTVGFRLNSPFFEMN